MNLCIDTTTSEAGITLVGHGRRSVDPHNASESILVIIDELIKKADIKLTDLKGIFVIKGPGSFTGLRVGIAVANQFAHQLNIPIIGLKTDEWWRYRTDESDFVYLQSMNKAEVYISDFGFRISDSILPIENLSGTKKWLGQLSEDHSSKLPSTFTQITDVLSPKETWTKIVQTTNNKQQTAYNLVEPYYGKKPMITKSKKKMHI